MDAIRTTMPLVGPPGADERSLLTQARSGRAAAIDEAARGFEAAMLSTMLKEMRQTLEEGGMFAGDKSDVFGGLFDMFMSQHLAKQAPLGIADLVRNRLTQTHQRL